MQSPYLPLLNAELVTVKIVYVNGVEPPEGSVESAIAGFEKYLEGEVDLLEQQSVHSETSGPVLSQTEFESLVKEHAELGSNTITVFVTPRLAFFNRRGFYQYALMRGGDERHIIVLSGDVIDAAVVVELPELAHCLC